MSIQQNVNQALSLGGYLYSQTPMAQNARRGKQFQKSQQEGIEGLKDIHGNINRALESRKKGLQPGQEGYKSYTNEELSNMYKRARTNQDLIYDAKAASLNPSYRRYIKSDLIGQPEISKMLGEISKGTSELRKPVETKPSNPTTEPTPDEEMSAALYSGEMADEAPTPTPQAEPLTPEEEMSSMYEIQEYPEYVPPSTKYTDEELDIINSIFNPPESASEKRERQARESAQQRLTNRREEMKPGKNISNLINGNYEEIDDSLMYLSEPPAEERIEPKKEEPVKKDNKLSIEKYDSYSDDFKDFISKEEFNDFLKRYSSLDDVNLEELNNRRELLDEKERELTGQNREAFTDEEYKDINYTTSKSLENLLNYFNLDKKNIIDSDEFLEYYFTVKPGRYKKLDSFIKNKDNILESTNKNELNMLLHGFVSRAYYFPELSKIAEGLNTIRGDKLIYEELLEEDNDGE